MNSRRVSSLLVVFSVFIGILYGDEIAIYLLGDPNGTTVGIFHGIVSGYCYIVLYISYRGYCAARGGSGQEAA